MSQRIFYISAAILLLSLVAVIKIHSRGTPNLVFNPLDHIPLTIGEFEGSKDKYPESVYSVLNADTNIYRHYRNPAGQQVDLYIGYYSTEKGGRSTHTPYGCLPGSGWGILKSSYAELHPEGYDNRVEVNEILASKGQLQIILLHWYQVEGNKVLKNGIEHNLERLKNRFLNNRSDGAFIQVSAVADAGGIDKAAVAAKKLSRSLLQLLPKYWPEEKSE